MAMWQSRVFHETDLVMWGFDVGASLHKNTSMVVSFLWDELARKCQKFLRSVKLCLKKGKIIQFEVRPWWYNPRQVLL